MIQGKLVYLVGLLLAFAELAILTDASALKHNLASMKKLIAPILILAAHASSSGAGVLSFQYEQTDQSTGSGLVSGHVEGIYFNGVLPPATVMQQDDRNLPLPEGYVGYINGWDAAREGTPFGVHLGWDGSVSLIGEKVIDRTTVQFYELELPLVLDAAPDADWSYRVTLTDDGKGNGNDAFGTNLRLAGWIGEPGAGHRHSADTMGSFAQATVDRREVNGVHRDVGEFGRGDRLGITVSLRDANGAVGPATLAEEGNGSGVLYVDDLHWQGGFTVDLASNVPIPTTTGLAADFNADGHVDLADLVILTNHFNLDNTTRMGGGDLTGDRRTDLHDFVTFRDAFAAVNLSTVAATPEPDFTYHYLLLLMLWRVVAPQRRQSR